LVFMAGFLPFQVISQGSESGGLRQGEIVRTNTNVRCKCMA